MATLAGSMRGTQRTMPGKQAVQHAGSQRVAPAAVTISESELYTLRKEAESPIATRKPVVSMQRDVQEGKKRAEFMRQHDMEALRKKAESGALEGEAVEAIAKKLEAGIRESFTAQKFLAEERKGHVVRTLEQQLEFKRRREAAEKQHEEEVHSAMIRDIAAGVEREERRRRDIQLKREHVKLEIDKQLDERAFQRLLDIESREQEGELLAAAARRAAEAAEAKVRAAKEQARERAKELHEANRQFAERDVARKRREAEADELIRMYQLEKAAREEEAEQRRRAEAEAKKKRQAAMIAEQKKASDNKAAEDEKKAREHEERKILADRARMKGEAERKEREKKEIYESLDLQLSIKEAKKREMAEREEELRQFQLQQAAEDIEREALTMEARKRREYEAKQALVAQKEARDRAKQEELKRPLLERQAQAQVEAAEKLALERFRASVRGRMEKDDLPNTFVHKVATLRQRTN